MPIQTFADHPHQLKLELKLKEEEKNSFRRQRYNTHHVQGLVMAFYCCIAYYMMPIMVLSKPTTTPSVPRVCRENPDWPGSLYSKCRNATGYNPNANFPFWFDQDTFWAESYPHTHAIRGCLTQTLSEWWETEYTNGIYNHNNEKEETEIPSPWISYSGTNQYGDSVVFEIANALTEQEDRSVKMLAHCIRDVRPNGSFEHRTFPTGGGNDVTFINLLLPKFLPGVANQLFMLLHMVHEDITFGSSEGESMNHPPSFLPHGMDPSKLGIRTCEHLSYRVFDNGLGVHKDSGSVYTVLLFLSDPQDYDGGHFHVVNKGMTTMTTAPTLTTDDVVDEEILFKPPKLTAIVFLSDLVDHGVKPIPRGVRETLATEFWVHPDLPPGFQRPPTDVWELYVERLVENPEARFPNLEDIKSFRQSGRSMWTKKKKKASSMQQQEQCTIDERSSGS